SLDRAFHRQLCQPRSRTKLPRTGAIKPLARRQPERKRCRPEHKVDPMTSLRLTEDDRIGRRSRCNGFGQRSVAANRQRDWRLGYGHRTRSQASRTAQRYVAYVAYRRDAQERERSGHDAAIPAARRRGADHWGSLGVREPADFDEAFASMARDPP